MEIAVSLLFAVAGALLADPVLRVWDKFSALISNDLLKKCEKTSFDMSNFHYYMRLWGFALFSVAVVGIAYRAGHYFLLSTVVLFLLAVTPRQVVRYLIKRREFKLKEQLVSAINVIVNTTKAGMALEQALQFAAKETPAPLGSEFRRIVGEYEHGRTFEQTLEDSKRRMNFTEYVVFVTTLLTNKKKGGNIMETLTEIRRSLMENQRLERKLEADTASGRMVINVLSVFPIGFLLLSYAINRDGTILLFETIKGQLILNVATIATYVGYRWGQKVAEIEF